MIYIRCQRSVVSYKAVCHLCGMPNGDGVEEQECNKTQLFSHRMQTVQGRVLLYIHSAEQKVSHTASYSTRASSQLSSFIRASYSKPLSHWLLLSDNSSEMSSIVTMKHPVDLTCPSDKHHMLVADSLGSYSPNHPCIPPQLIRSPLSSSDHLITPCPSSSTRLQTTLNTSPCPSQTPPFANSIMPPCI